MKAYRCSQNSVPKERESKLSGLRRGQDYCTLFKTMVKLKLNFFGGREMPQDNQDEYIDFLNQRTNHYYFLAIYISMTQGENLKKMTVLLNVAIHFHPSHPSHLPPNMLICS